MSDKAGRRSTTRAGLSIDHRVPGTNLSAVGEQWLLLIRAVGTSWRSGVAGTRPGRTRSVSDKAGELFQAGFDPPNILPKQRDPPLLRPLQRFDLRVCNRYLAFQANNVRDPANDHCQEGQRQSTYAQYHFPRQVPGPCWRDRSNISRPTGQRITGSLNKRLREKLTAGRASWLRTNRALGHSGLWRPAPPVWRPPFSHRGVLTKPRSLRAPIADSVGALRSLQEMRRSGLGPCAGRTRVRERSNVDDRC